MASLAFEIGFDHYRLGLPLDIARFSDADRHAIRQGYEAAQLQKVTRKHPDLYERKLLSIRDRALSKGLCVTIDCDDLAQAFNKTQGRCPITGIPFTFAENQATDWSVDRINNERGYCPDNIVVVSVKVNQAKSDLDLAGIIKAALEHQLVDRDADADLDWFRLAKFYFKKMDFVKPLSFCRLLSNTQRFYEHFVFMLLFQNKCNTVQQLLKQLAKYISKETIQKTVKLACRRVYHRRDIRPEVLYDSPKLYRSVQLFIQTINAHSREFDGLLLNCLFA